MCLRGVSEVKSAIGDIDADVHVAWVPMLDATASDAPPGAKLYPAALHYWDEGGRLIRGYRATLEIDEPAWDIYMVYPPGVVRSDAGASGTRLLDAPARPQREPAREEGALPRRRGVRSKAP